MALFSALKQFGKKGYKFQQRKSYDLIDENYTTELPDGVCMGIVLVWIKEKLTDGTVMESKFKPSLAHSDVHARNQITTLKSAQIQLLEENGGIIEAATELGLRLSNHTTPWVRNREGVFNTLATLTNAATDLPRGVAAVIRVHLSDRITEGSLGTGHAIGLYKSRGGHLHFFDPNIGVYAVRDIEGFMQAWIDGCYYGRNWSMTPARHSYDWIECFER